MNDQKDTTTPKRDERAADSALSASPGSRNLVQRLRQDGRIMSRFSGFPTVTSELFEAADMIEALELTLRSIDAATDLKTARRMAEEWRDSYCLVQRDNKTHLLPWENSEHRHADHEGSN